VREQPLRVFDAARKTDAIEDVADRAQAYGFKGHVCSGNDLLAVLELSERMIAKTRAGEGPVLIECKTYRYRGHSEHDAALYRDKEELIEWQSRDPIPRFEFYLEKKGHEIKAIREQIDERVNKNGAGGGGFRRKQPSARTSRST